MTEAQHRLNTTIAVDDFPVEALIGANPDERLHRQPLIISVELELEPGSAPEAMPQTIDYCAVAGAAAALANDHIELIEHYARLLGERCLALGATSAKVSVAKPRALSSGMARTVVSISRDRSAAIDASVPAASERCAVAHLTFRPDINTDAQEVLAKFFCDFARSLDGVAGCAVHPDAAKGHWIARMTTARRPIWIEDRAAGVVSQLRPAPQRKTGT